MSALNFALADMPELDPEPHTRGRQPNAHKTRTSVTVRPQTGPNMLKAALWYAKRGWHVFPLHAPLFDDAGVCVGCTCEAWKRTHYNKPDYKCPQPGKCPAIRWAEKSTTDSDQLHKWFGHPWKTTNVETGGTVYFTPNLGIDCSKSGLLTWDRDTYKDGYADVPNIGYQQRQTVTSLTGSGGEQLIYLTQGKRYSNATGDLPYGNDIRGVGGYIVAPPSLHKSGRRYQFEEGYNPAEIELQPIPQALQAILDIAQAKSVKAQAVIFTTPTTEKPDLLRWKTSKAIRELISGSGTGDRSKADMRVVTALLYAGATADEIKAVFQHERIGTEGKYAERGDYYLGLTIGKASAYVELHPRLEVVPTLHTLRMWARTHSFARFIPAEKLSADGLYRGDGTDTRVCDALCAVMIKANRFDITTGLRRIAKLAGVGFKTVLRAFERMNGWLFKIVSDKTGHHITLPVDALENGFAWMTHLFSSTTVQQQGVSSTRNHFDTVDEYASRKAHDAFLTGTSKTMRGYIEFIAAQDPVVRDRLIASRADADTEDAVETTPYDIAEELYTRPALGEPSLRVLDYLPHNGNAGTVDEIAQGTGMKQSTTWRACRKLALANLLNVDKMPNAPAIYTVVDQVWERLSEIEPTLRSYRLSNERNEKHYLNSQKWLVREYGAAKTEAEEDVIERRYMRIAKKRMANLLILNPGKTEEELEERYQVYGMLSAAKFAKVDHTDRSLYDQHQRQPEALAAVQAERHAQRIEQREKVALIADLVIDQLDAGVTKDQVISEVAKFGLDEYIKDGELHRGELVRAVMSSKPLLLHAINQQGNRVIAQNIAAMRAEGLERNAMIWQLKTAGFMQIEIDQALAGGGR